MDDIFKILFYDWQQKLPQNIIQRQYNINDSLASVIKKIIVLTGFRRVGKTTLMLDFAAKVKSINEEEMVYINFEDERIPLDTAMLTNLIPAINEFYKKPLKVLLLDEIQLIPGWSKWLRRIHDNTDFTIVISGSNSKMSSSEIPTELRGRFLEKHINPLNFREFLKFKNFTENLTEIEFKSSDFSKLKVLLDEFILYGGLPEIVLESELYKMQIAQSYFNTVVTRDISERYIVKNSNALKTLLKLLVNSQSFTISRLHNILKSNQIDIGKNTIAEYLTFIENSYFFRYVSCFSFNVKNGMSVPRKVYCVDRVFLTALSNKFTQNFGWFYENVVASELFNLYEEVYYWKSVKNDYEVDFVVRVNQETTMLIQVCFDIENEVTLKRETRALISASKELNCNTMFIVTRDKEQLIDEEWFGTKATIKLIPLWKWLLQQPL